MTRRFGTGFARVGAGFATFGLFGIGELPVYLFQPQIPLAAFLVVGHGRKLGAGGRLPPQTPRYRHSRTSDYPHSVHCSIKNTALQQQFTIPTQFC
jgi:hypothetical protein